MAELKEGMYVVYNNIAYTGRDEIYYIDREIEDSVLAFNIRTDTSAWMHKQNFRPLAIQYGDEILILAKNNYRVINICHSDIQGYYAVLRNLSADDDEPLEVALDALFKLITRF